MKQPKDYVTKEERLTFTARERIAFWWKWKGKDWVSLIVFFMLILILSSII